MVLGPGLRVVGVQGRSSQTVHIPVDGGVLTPLKLVWTQDIYMPVYSGPQLHSMKRGFRISCEVVF